MAKVLETRERLLMAAAAAIDKGGEAAVRIRDITEICEITAPSIYHFFGSREGLIDAAQAHRFSRGQIELGNAFSSATYACRSKKEFVNLAHQYLIIIFGPQRRPTRNTRLNVLGSAVHRPELAKKLATDQEVANKVVGDPIRYAQAKGWIKDDFEPTMFAVWLNGSINSRRLIEMDGTHPLADEWNVLAKRAICLVLGIPEPARKKPGATKKRK